MKLVKASLCLLIVAPMVTFAEDPATRPAAPAPPPQQQQTSAYLSPANRVGYDELRQFLQEHAPNRLEFFETIADSGDARRRLMGIWRDRYRAMLRTKEQDPELYMRMVRQFELQDQAIGLVRKAKAGEAPSTELRDLVSELVHTGISLRQQRIAKLEKQLQSEKEKLAHDQKNEQKLIDQQMETLRREGKELVKRMQPGPTMASPDSH
jgi:hypothetical protein